MAYNANSLYFYVTVVDASPLKNDGNRGDFQQLFYSGDALSICFGPYAGYNLFSITYCFNYYDFLLIIMIINYYKKSRDKHKGSSGAHQRRGRQRHLHHAALLPPRPLLSSL